MDSNMSAGISKITYNRPRYFLIHGECSFLAKPNSNKAGGFADERAATHRGQIVVVLKHSIGLKT
jgi:hypothetical protein